MQVEYRPCKQEHLALIRPQEHDREMLQAYMSPEFKELLDCSFGISAWVEHKPVGAAGIIPLHANCGLAWAMLGNDAGPYMLQLTRKVRNALDITPYKRVEMRVVCEFEEGHRWAKALGFTVEAPRMRKSSSRGNDETLYARVR